MTKTMAINFWPSKDCKNESALELGEIYIPRTRHTVFRSVSG